MQAITFEDLKKIVFEFAIAERKLEAKAGNDAIEAQYRSALAEAYENVIELVKTEGEIMALEMKYFILKPRAKSKDDPHAFASHAAMFAFADAIEDADASLANDLRRWAGREIARQTSLPEKV